MVYQNAKFSKPLKVIDLTKFRVQEVAFAKVSKSHAFEIISEGDQTTVLAASNRD